MSATLQKSPEDELQDLQDSNSPQGLLLALLTALAGFFLAVNLLPLWIPGLSFSANGDAPKVFWYLSRGSAIAAFWILWLAMAMGIIITNKMAQHWPGIPPAYEIHQYTSLFGMGLVFFHAFILIGDQFIHYTLPQILVPFASQNYRPTWVGFGQVALYLWMLVNLSFYVRKRMGKKAWHWIHFASYISFIGALVHGIYSGTDSSAPLVQALYWISGGTLLFLTIYRVLTAKFPEKKPHKLPQNHPIRGKEPVS